MSLKKLWMSVIALIIVASLGLAGCSGGDSKGKKETSKPAKKTGKDIVIAVQDNFVSLDPHDTNDTLSYSAQKTMMEGLVGFDEEMKVVPVLAESYEANDEATEFTFKLKENITFHDGTPFNAEAVKVNIDRLSNPDNGLKRYSLFALVKETQVVDEYTVKFTLSEPFGAMVNNFAHPAAMMHSPKSLEENGKDVARHPVGTGPFVFSEWNPGEKLTVVKNDAYWKEDLPKVDSISFKPVSENGSRVAMLQTGEADFIYPVPTEQADQIDGKNGIKVESNQSIIVRYLAMNTMKEPFNDVRVRKAINHAIDKEAFIQVVMNGYGDPLDSIIAPNTQFYSKQKIYDFDLEKAKQLMKEAGYENGFKTKVWGGNSSSTVKAMEFLQQQLAQIDIKLEVVPMESGTMADKVWSVQNPEDAEVELYYAGWSPSTGDADWGFRPLLGGKENFPPNSFNVSYYDDEKATSLIQAAIETAAPEKREAAYKEAQEILWNDAPWAFLSVDNTMAGKKEYLDGIYLLPDGSLSVENIEIK